MGRLHLQGIIQDMEDNFDYKKYIAEGKLYEAINLDIEDDIAILSGDSGEYEGEIEDGKTSFSIIYDDLDYRISDQYNENNIEDFLGKGHAFVELAKKYDHKWGIERDLVGITIKLKDLAEGKLLKEDITKLRGQELLDFFSYTKYMDVDVKALETEFIEAIDGGWFTDPSNFEEEKKDFTYESGDRFLDTNEDKMSEYLGFEIDIFRMSDDYTMGEPMGVEFVHSDEDFEGWMDEVGSFWD